MNTPRLSRLAPRLDWRSMSVLGRDPRHEGLDLGPVLGGGELVDQRVLGGEHRDRSCRSRCRAGW